MPAMTNLIWNPLALKWIARAPERISRPTGKTGACPLCPGNEEMTPPETWALRPEGSFPDTEGWLVRAVPNLYPAVTGPGMSHEVIVHSPNHCRDLAVASLEEATHVVQAWSARLDAFKSNPATKFAQISVNHGRAAGASLEHPHSQAIALSQIPPIAEAELLSTSISCPICQLLQEAKQNLFLRELEGLAALCPPWSEHPYEILIAPRDHQSAFERSGLEIQVAELLTNLLAALTESVSVEAYNVVLHTAPNTPKGSEFHWHIHAFGRVGTYAGIELGAGLPISMIDPARAAEALKGVKPL
ncbi:MAG: hypothetical protein DCC49_09625 [Acidobacteria bacterium]|nr:MAG: hypothetical protein DCC49_09625 [Acidobacteriota bacterium]